MKRTQLNKDQVELILQLHRERYSLNKIVNELGILRRVVKRTLKENGIEPKTKSQIIKEQIPQLLDRDLLTEMYYGRRMSIDGIAHQLGTNTQVIKNSFKNLNIKTIPQNLKRIQKHTPDLLKDKEFMVREYVEKKRSINSLAKQFGTSDTAIKTMLDYHNIDRRGFIEQVAVTERTEDQKLNSKIARRLRSRLSNALNNNQKAGSAVGDLGCSIEEFKKHLESQFTDGMTWDNYGYWGWHIDHIIPLSTFDLSDPDQFKQACHFTNLQPLWSNDNFKKSDSLGDKSDLFIVCGVSGSGKSWACNQLKDVSYYVSYDEIPREQHYYEFVEGSKSDLPILYDPFRSPTTILRRYSAQFNARLIVIDESLDTIVSRIKQRGGKPNIDSLEKIRGKIPRWKQYAEFSGTSDQVLEYLKNEMRKDEIDD